MADAYDLTLYLPQSFKIPSEREYISFLWESYEVNYNAGKYPFAFLAYHMLFMSFVYFEVWQIRENRRSAFEMAMVGFNLDNEKKLLNATTPFAFWLVNESSFFRFLKLLECNNERIGNFAAIVKNRNESAHSNGNIFFNSQSSIDRKIDDIMRFVDEIQILSTPILEDCLTDFLKNSWNADEREYPGDLEQIQEILIHGNYLSQKDTEQMTRFDINKLSAEPNFAEIKALFDVFAANYRP
jgi:hypothetical protein